MKHLLHCILFCSCAGLLLSVSGCTTVIDAKLDKGPNQLSVDATLTNQPGPQTIRLTNTAAYFDNSTPTPVTNAAVTVTDNIGKLYLFLDPKNTGAAEANKLCSEWWF